MLCQRPKMESKSKKRKTTPASTSSTLKHFFPPSTRPMYDCFVTEAPSNCPPSGDYSCALTEYCSRDGTPLLVMRGLGNGQSCYFSQGQHFSSLCPSNWNSGLYVINNKSVRLDMFTPLLKKQCSLDLGAPLEIVRSTQDSLFVSTETMLHRINNSGLKICKKLVEEEQFDFFVTRDFLISVDIDSKVTVFSKDLLPLKQWWGRGYSAITGTNDEVYLSDEHRIRVYSIWGQLKTTLDQYFYRINILRVSENGKKLYVFDGFDGSVTTLCL